MKKQIKNFLETLKYNTVDINIELFDFLIEKLFYPTLKIDTKLLKRNYNSVHKKMLYSCFNIFIEHVQRKIIFSYREQYSVDENMSDLDCLKDFISNKCKVFDKIYFEEIYNLYIWWMNIRPIRIAIYGIDNYWDISYENDNISQYPFLFQDEKNKTIYNKDKEKYIGNGIYEVEDSIMLSRLLDIVETLF